MQYKLIRAHSIDELQDQINTYLEFDWVLYGNPFRDNGCYHQALTRKR